MVGRHQYGGPSSVSMSAAAAGKSPNKLLWRMQLQQPCLSLSQREVAESITSWCSSQQSIHFIVHPLYFKHHQTATKTPLVTLRSWPAKTQDTNNHHIKIPEIWGSYRLFQTSVMTKSAKSSKQLTFPGGKKHAQLKYVTVCYINGYNHPSPVSSAVLNIRRSKNLQTEFVAYEIVQHVDEKA